jgi:hypothetical protein
MEMEHNIFSSQKQYDHLKKPKETRMKVIEYVIRKSLNTNLSLEPVVSLSINIVPHSIPTATTFMASYRDNDVTRKGKYVPTALWSYKTHITREIPQTSFD